MFLPLTWLNYTLIMRLVHMCKKRKKHDQGKQKCLVLGRTSKILNLSPIYGIKEMKPDSHHEYLVENKPYLT